MGSKDDAKVYDYRYALDYALCQGPLDSINYVWIKDRRAFCGSVRSRRDLCIDAPKLFGGDAMEGGIDGTIECYIGSDDQVSSDHLARRMGFDGSDPAKPVEKAPAYPGLAHLFFRRSGQGRGGFRWGTNNPYLPGIKASVTRIPRQLGDKWSVVWPLTQTYKRGLPPDQRDPDSYGAPEIVSVSEEDEFHVTGGFKKLVWNQANVWAYQPILWFRNGDYVQVVNHEPVGQCDASYKTLGFTQSGIFRILGLGGTPIAEGLCPAEAAASGAAFFEIYMAGEISHIGLIGGDSLGITHNYCLEQYAADSFGRPTNEVLRFGWGSFIGNEYLAREPLHPRCRYIKIGMSTGPQWIYNSVKVTEQRIRIKYPDVEFQHCNKEATLTELPDANPMHIIYELLLDSDERENTNMEQYIDKNNALSVAEKLWKEGFGMSIRQDESVDRKELIKKIAEHIRGAVFQHPVTGKWTTKLFRADYDVNTLEVVTQSDCRIKSGQRRAYAQCLSEITVEYTHPNEENTASVTAHNDTAAEITGNRVPEVRSYQFVRNEALAQIIADRDVAEASYPLWTGTLLMSRKHWKKAPGDVFILNYQDDDFQISNMVVRVMNVDFGNLTDRTITVDVAEDIFSVARTEYRAPQSVIDDDSSVSKPRRLAMPQYMIPMSLPQPLVERLGLISNIEDADDHYRFILFGSPDYELDYVSIHSRNYVDNTQTQIATISATPCSVMSEALNFDVFSYISITTIEKAAPGGVLPGDLLMISSAIDAKTSKWDANEECRSEIIELIQYDPENMRWKVKRGVFDTVPRQWDVGSLLWHFTDNLESAILTHEILDRNEDPYPWWGKIHAGDKETSDSGMFRIPVNSTARNHLPHRPGNVKVNGIGPDAYIDTALNSTVLDLTITWSTRNKDGEEATVPAWSDGDFAVSGIRYKIRFVDPDDKSKVRYETEFIPGSTAYITGNSVTVPVAATAPRGVALVEVWAIDSDGKQSFMASQNYVQIDKVALDYQGWDYQFGRNWNGARIE